jgi:hypothetical protein
VRIRFRGIESSKFSRTRCRYRVGLERLSPHMRSGGTVADTKAGIDTEIDIDIKAVTT